ncbi:MAG: flagellar hook protein FlgE [Actinomycetota bacterium]
MIRSMYAAVSGLRSHQTMMDVVGNNIANVNTHGYKRNSTIFQDVLSQTVRGAGTPTDNLGGTNPAQVGLGVTVSGTAQNFSQGFLQITNRDMDLAIQGDGFFVLETDAPQRMYTRAGTFFLDAENRLVSSEGGLVQGWMADPDTGEISSTFHTTNLSIPIGDLTAPVITSEIKFGGNLPGELAVGETVVTGLEVYDSQGNFVPLSLTFTKTAVHEWTATAEYGDPATAITLTDNVVTFVDGEVSAPGDFTIDIAAGQIPDMGDIALVIGGDTERRLTQFGVEASVTAVSQDGSAAGVLTSVRTGTDGVISGTYSNGRTKPVAQIALASFANPGGLERVTGSSWIPSVNSGLAQVGDTNTGGRGIVAAGALEMSNVDLASEFTTLIQSQRGFQANSRVVTSSDELLQEIVNLKR